MAWQRKVTHYRFIHATAGKLGPPAVYLPTSVHITEETSVSIPRERGKPRGRRGSPFRPPAIGAGREIRNTIRAATRRPVDDPSFKTAGPEGVVRRISEADRGF